MHFKILILLDKCVSKTDYRFAEGHECSGFETRITWEKVIYFTNLLFLFCYEIHVLIIFDTCWKADRGGVTRFEPKHSINNKH